MSEAMEQEKVLVSVLRAEDQEAKRAERRNDLRGHVLQHKNSNEDGPDTFSCSYCC
jgi:hypothetical protein